MLNTVSNRLNYVRLETWVCYLLQFGDHLSWIETFDVGKLILKGDNVLLKGILRVHTFEALFLIIKS